jgi:hypothetical protein
VPILVLGAVAVVVAMVFLVGWMVRLGLEPTWWPGTDAESKATKVLAQDVESRVLSAASQVRPRAASTDAGAAAAVNGYRSDEWALTVSQNEANAWLATSLQAWLASLDRPGLTLATRVAFVPGGVMVGVRDPSGAYSTSQASDEDGRTYWAEIKTRVDQVGVHLRVRRVGIGRIELSAARLRTLAGAVMSKSDDVDRARLNALLAGDELLVAERGFPLADGRRVRVVGVEALAGELRLRMVTEKAAAGENGR